LIFSVIIPAHNEALFLEQCVSRVESFLFQRHADWEILVVSDGSTDGTDAILEEMARRRKDDRLRPLCFPERLGKGFAVRQGILAARGDILLVTDVNLSTPIKESDKLLAALDEGFDAAIGSRAIKKEGCDVQLSLSARFSSALFNGLARFLLLPDFKDTQCGFMCFKREVARRIFSLQKTDGISFEIEALYLAKRNSFRVKEVPVMWREERPRRGRISVWRDGPRVLKELRLIRQYHAS
jgi:glycosyltransferase involved in cell wall biosynthesis